MRRNGSREPVAHRLALVHDGREAASAAGGTVMKIAEFMTQGVYTVHPHDTLEKAAGVMWEHDCGAVPVVEHDGRVVAMITDRDICMAAYTQGRRLSAMRVDSAMSQR